MGEKWVPEFGEKYCAIRFNVYTGEALVYTDTWENHYLDSKIKNSELGIFRTEHLCQLKCDELNARLAEPKYDPYEPPPDNLDKEILILFSAVMKSANPMSILPGRMVRIGWQPGDWWLPVPKRGGEK